MSEAAIFNCECVTDEGYQTLAQLRRRMMVRLGYAAQADNPPPGMADLLNDFLQSTQRTLLQKNPGLEQERFFKWQMFAGQRYYGISDGCSGCGGFSFVAGQDGGGCAPEIIGYDEELDIGSVVSDACAPYDLIAIYAENFQPSLVLKLEGEDAPPPDDGYGSFVVKDSLGAVLFSTEDNLPELIETTDNVKSYIWNTGGYIFDGMEGDTFTVVFGSTALVTRRLNKYKVSWVGFEDLNGAWYPLVKGINPVLYSRTVNLEGWPSNYEIRSCIEVWPAPQAPFTLWIRGQFGLEAFEADTDNTTLDSELVFLFALGMAKTHYGKPDASAVLGQANEYLLDSKAGKHLTARYIPGTRTMVPLVPPIFLPLAGS